MRNNTVGKLSVAAVCPAYLNGSTDGVVPSGSVDYVVIYVFAAGSNPASRITFRSSSCEI